LQHDLNERMRIEVWSGQEHNYHESCQTRLRSEVISPGSNHSCLNHPAQNGAWNFAYGKLPRRNPYDRPGMNAAHVFSKTPDESGISYRLKRFDLFRPNL
jgi:hypothetical protein